VQREGNILTEKPRLLIVLNRFVIGGQTLDIIPLAWHLRESFDILIVYGEKEKDEVEPFFLLKKFPGLKLQKVRHLKKSINPVTDVVAFFKLLILIKRFKAHIVHTHFAKSGFLGRLSAFLCGVPVIVHTFHGHFFHSYFSKTVSAIIAAVERVLTQISTSIIALSETQKDELVYVFKVVPIKKIKIIPLGFETGDNYMIPECRNSFRSRYALQENDIAVGIVGRIVPVKNHSFFVDVVDNILSNVRGERPAFFVIGDGDLRPEIEMELKQKRILFNNHSVTTENRVVFTSWITDMYEVMNGLDIIVLTSLNEGTPLSIIEAQVFKRPVVATNVGGVKDTIVDGKTGFLSESNDVNSFSAKLRLLIENKDLRTSMGEEGNKFASARFSKKSEIEATKELYFTLLSKKGYYFSQLWPADYKQ
jgi:glycosyltransferase involved in cell wall biosynthesis